MQARIHAGHEVDDATDKTGAVKIVRPAAAYEAVGDLWVVTSYFNPVGYRSRLRNYEVFRDRIVASRLPLLTVECAFGDDAFALPPSPQVVRVRSRHVMWQKECLLNLAISCLPAHCTKVAWVDADTLFENPHWATETSRLLDRYPVVQPFDIAMRLLPGEYAPRADGDVWRGFAAAQSTDSESLRTGDYRRHGETGLAWAAQRAVLDDCGLYDACIIGGGDHVMAHAMCGDWGSVCIDRLIGRHTPQLAHMRRWGERMHARVRGAIAFVPGAALHLWHGEREGRRYSARHRELAEFGFDPERDLRRGESGCWEWASDKPEMHRWAAAYFAGRCEDGEAAAPIDGHAEPNSDRRFSYGR